MNADSKKFLFKLLSTPSPTGFEQKIQKLVKNRMKQYADTVETDLHGNQIFGINTSAKKKIMLAGHCDQIGFMVKHITEDGFIYVMPLGGIDTGVLPGASVTIYTEKGDIEGVIGRKPIHLQKPDERSKAKIAIEDVWIDIGAKTQKEVERLIKIGDPATLKLGVTELRNSLISATGLDDRVGLFVAMEALRLCSRGKLDVALYAVSTVQEEVGLRGARTSAFNIDPEVGIAIDVTHATDNPGHPDLKASPCVLGKGPAISVGPSTNPVVHKRLVDEAKKGKIPYQPAPSSRMLGNDANAIQINRAGVAAAAIGIPNRYMHTQVEVCSLDDLENAARLLARFIKGLSARTDFRPR